MNFRHDVVLRGSGPVEEGEEGASHFYSPRKKSPTLVLVNDLRRLDTALITGKTRLVGKDPTSETRLKAEVACKICKAMPLNPNARKVRFHLHNKTLFTVVLLFLAQLCFAPAHAQIEVGDNDFQISFTVNLAASHDADRPTIAYNSTDNEYLVVWDATAVVFVDPAQIDRRVIWAKLIDGATGAAINTVQVSTFLSSGRVALFPAAVYNSVENEFLVVWVEDDGGVLAAGEFEIFGQILSSSLAPTGGDNFRISDMGGTGNANFRASKPAVAFNSIENEYLVVWESDDDDGLLVNDEFEIFGQRLNENGTAQGLNDFRISDMGNDGDNLFGAFEPAVAYNSMENEYLVVWTGDDNIGQLVDNEFEIFGQRLNENGTAQGLNDTRISDTGGTGDTSFFATSPKVAYNGEANEYLVVWAGDDDDGDLVDNEFEIFGQRLNENGTAQGTNDFRISDMGPTGDSLFGAFGPDVTFNSEVNEYLVVWVGDDNVGQLVNNENEIFGQRLDETGTAQGSNDFRISDMGGTGDNPFDAFDPAVAFNSEVNEYLVVWRGDDDVGALLDEDFEIFGQRLDLPLFADGFESGDTFAWSASVP